MSGRLSDSTALHNGEKRGLIEDDVFFKPQWAVIPEDDNLYEITRDVSKLQSAVNQHDQQSPQRQHPVCESSSSTSSAAAAVASLAAATVTGGLTTSTCAHKSSSCPSGHSAIKCPSSPSLGQKLSSILQVNHQVSMLPLNSTSNLDIETISVLTRGTYALHIEEETGRAAIVYLILEEALNLLLWSRGNTSGFKGSFNQPSGLHSLSTSVTSGVTTSTGNASSSTTLRRTPSPLPQSCSSVSSVNIPNELIDRLCTLITNRYENYPACNSTTSSSKYSDDYALTGLEDGYLDLMMAHSVTMNQLNNCIDFTAICKKSGIKLDEINTSCIKIAYGLSLTENKSITFILPKNIYQVWLNGLTIIINELKRQLKLSDQRIIWLKLKYLQLYFKSSNFCPYCNLPNLSSSSNVLNYGSTFTGKSNVINLKSSKNFKFDSFNIRRNSCSSTTFPLFNLTSSATSTTGNNSLVNSDGNCITLSRFRRPTPADAVKSFGGRQWSFNCFESNTFTSSGNSNTLNTFTCNSVPGSRKIKTDCTGNSSSSHHHSASFSLPSASKSLVSHSTIAKIKLLKKKRSTPSFNSSSCIISSSTAAASKVPPEVSLTSSSPSISSTVQIKCNKPSSSTVPNTREASVNSSLDDAPSYDLSSTVSDIDPVHLTALAKATEATYHSQRQLKQQKFEQQLTPSKSRKKYSVSEDTFNRQRSLRWSLRKTSTRHSFSFLTPFRSRRDSSDVTELNDTETSSSGNLDVKSTSDVEPSKGNSSKVTEEFIQQLNVSGLLTSNISDINCPHHHQIHCPFHHQYHKQPSSLKRMKTYWFGGSQKNIISNGPHRSDKSNSSSGQFCTECAANSPFNLSLNKSSILKPSIAHSSSLSFIEFKDLYRSFMIRSRGDIRELFEKLLQDAKIVSNYCNDTQVIDDKGDAHCISKVTQASVKDDCASSSLLVSDEISHMSSSMHQEVPAVAAAAESQKSSSDINLEATHVKDEKRDPSSHRITTSNRFTGGNNIVIERQRDLSRTCNKKTEEETSESSGGGGNKDAAAIFSGLKRDDQVIGSPDTRSPSLSPGSGSGNASSGAITTSATLDQVKLTTSTTTTATTNTRGSIKKSTPDSTSTSAAAIEIAISATRASDTKHSTATAGNLSGDYCTENKLQECTSSIVKTVNVSPSSFTRTTTNDKCTSRNDCIEHTQLPSKRVDMSHEKPLLASTGKRAVDIESSTGSSSSSMTSDCKAPITSAFVGTSSGDTTVTTNNSGGTMKGQKISSKKAMIAQVTTTTTTIPSTHTIVSATTTTTTTVVASVATTTAACASLTTTVSSSKSPTPRVRSSRSPSAANCMNIVTGGVVNTVSASLTSTFRPNIRRASASSALFSSSGANNPLSSSLTSSILTVGAGTAATTTGVLSCNRSPLTSTPPSSSPSSIGSGSLGYTTNSAHGMSHGFTSIDLPMNEKLKLLASGNISATGHRGHCDKTGGTGASGGGGSESEPRRRKSLSISLSSYRAEQFASASLKQIKQLGKKLQSSHSIDERDSSAKSSLRTTVKNKKSTAAATIEEEVDSTDKNKSQKCKSHDEIIIKENTNGLLR